MLKPTYNVHYICKHQSHEPELDENNDIGDPDGDHRSDRAPLDSEKSQAGHRSCLFQLLHIGVIMK